MGKVVLERSISLDGLLAGPVVHQNESISGAEHVKFKSTKLLETANATHLRFFVLTG
jgi:hypothetical protein